MELREEIGQFELRIKKMLPQVNSEDLTRNALVMPFIRLMGYDINDVKTDAVVDFGFKKGKRVDYTIMKDGKPTILVECKHHLDYLGLDESRLLNYFRKTKAKYGLLTNGLVYQFYTEKMVKSKKAQTPLLEFKLTDTKAAAIALLLEEHQDFFNLNKQIA
ncbi:hypothetical protein ABIB40_001237 [Pedobacter sp. UYP30]|uniref:type I restriction enzyme HsdR N-terminal domain-containing protein n=1 Tax=Pedobacter sp. UYP30 TaxID=1756400 RepID=UPI003398DD7C